MALPDFPNNPTLNEQFTVGTNIYQWDGEKWKALSNADNSLRSQLADVDSTVLVGGVAAGNLSESVGQVVLPLDATNQDLIDALSVPNRTVVLKEGVYSNLTEGLINLTEVNSVNLIGQGKHKTLIPYGVTLRVIGSTGNCFWSGFGMTKTTGDLDLTNSPRIIRLEETQDTFYLHDIKYEIIATNPNAGGGGIAIEYRKNCNRVICDDIYTLNASVSGIWSGRKEVGTGTRCEYGLVKNSLFELTVRSAYPVGHNVSEVKEIYSINNEYRGFKPKAERVVATVDPNADNVFANHYLDTLRASDGDLWLAAIDVGMGNGSGGSRYTWVQSSAVDNIAYGLYTGDSTDSSTGLDGPEVVVSIDERFYECDNMIKIQWADEQVVQNAIDINQTCNDGFVNPGLESGNTAKPLPRLIRVAGGVMPCVFASKAEHLDLSSPPTILGNSNGRFEGIKAVANNAPSFSGGSVVIGPVTIRDSARGGISVDGYQNVQIRDGYYIENCGSAGNQTLNRDDGIFIGNTSNVVETWSIGEGVIKSTDGNMPVGINVWSVRNKKGSIHPAVSIVGATNPIGNTTGIYGAYVTKNPANGEFVGPPAGTYKKGEVIYSHDGRFMGWVAVQTGVYGQNPYWQSTASYSIGDRVSYGGYEWEAVTNNAGSDPLISGTTDWTPVGIRLKRFGQSVDY